MTRAEFQAASPNAHLLIGEMPAPAQFAGRWWEGTGLSLLAHALVIGILVYAATHVRQVAYTISHLTISRDEIRSAGGGSHGTVTPEAPRHTNPPAAKPPVITPAVNLAEAAPPLDAHVPDAVPLDPTQALPGASTPGTFNSPGPGTGPGDGAGRGPGEGPSDGPGAGPGSPGGFVPIAGNGVSSPQLLHEVKPNYTADAMRAKVQGTVEMEVVVRADGSVDPDRIRVTRSLDSIFGLDRQAILAVTEWRFKPGTLRGHPVPVRVIVELTFTLR